MTYNVLSGTFVLYTTTTLSVIEVIKYFAGKVFVSVYTRVLAEIF